MVSVTTASLFLALALTTQAQEKEAPKSVASPTAARVPSAEEVRKAAAAESKHLKNIRQVTFNFGRAGEGYFRPDGKGIIFQAAAPGP